ncbi:1-acyl-sn-glycerol-3-phosphate acyltransferase [Acinetobacter stercoris]|uniref:Acyltransferase n=1 Tax=Acinetobacter stercoris TaxID=2126983 RepID=A0A2U3N2K1_9GAMM|nr:MULTISPECIES: 1-acyl-sn-glycerol-3-phosphate acyltransferase [Acinetobacter]SPL71863.1 Acyltransferase [Acinetobacter stercoris]
MSKNFPALPPLVPKRGTNTSRSFFKNLFKLQGWSFEGEFPDLPKAVAIVMPHTSNYDAWYGFMAMLGLGLRLTIFGKDSLFNSPLKKIYQWMGVIPVHRDSPHGLTEQIIQIIQQQEQIWIAIAPEGTRKSAENIKTGFYRIAEGAHIPIAVFSLDYDKKSIHVLGVVEATGNYEKDLADILKLHEGKFSAKNKNWLSKPLQNLLKKN